MIIDSSQLAALSTSALTRSSGYVLIDQPTDGTLITKGQSNKVFVAAFATMTRPGNTTTYSPADSISNNVTASLVTSIVASVSDTNGDPIFVSDILISSSDTGLAAAQIRAYLFNADPTANSGVGAGDNAAYKQKVSGYVGSFYGTLETGFSDGTVGRLVPSFNDGSNTQAEGFIATNPVSSSTKLYIQYQAITTWTPANTSSTIIGTARGWQARAS